MIVTQIPGSDRPTLDYNTNHEGRLASDEFTKAKEYMKTLDERVLATKPGAYRIALQMELCKFLKTLPAKDQGAIEDYFSRIPGRLE